MPKVYHQICIQEGCNTRAVFNFEGETRGKYCSNHVLDGMIDIGHKRCLQEGCHKRPSYNYQDRKQGMYCNEHKENGMIDVVNKRCFQEGCQKRPSYNYQDQKQGMYCNEHKENGMIDVVNRRCIQEGCKTFSTFNYEGNQSPLYCYDHKSDDMINVVDKMCNLCPTYANKKYRGYCARCFIHTFPDESISKNYKVKERHVHDALEAHFKDLFIYNKRIHGGCSRRIPDWFFEKLTHTVFVECDENQHEDYSCENKRMMELFVDVGSRPVVFIRFNPDKYTDKNNKKIPSSFKYHKTLQVPLIRDANEWTNRMNTLIKTIEYNLENIPEKEVTIINLFYDGYIKH
jgi:EsV-1-7 cysteine-rich motif